jgi:serine/threonine-protein kinase
MKSVGADPVPFLKRIQLAHSSDFWANLSLAEALMEKADLPEAIRFYQAAVALRPGTAVVHTNLGLALAMLGRMDDADDQFRQAEQIDPTAPAQKNLGVAFSTMGRRDEALDRSNLPEHFRDKVAVLHQILADNLRDKGKLVEARDRYRQAILLDPMLASAHHGLRTLLLRQGRLDEMRLAWGQAIDAGLPDYDAWDGYAELCLYLGQEAEYRRVRQGLLDRFGTSTDVQTAERTGRACLLLPGSAEELQKSEGLIDRALAGKHQAPEWAQWYYQFAKGLAEYRQGRLDRALAVMDGEAAKVLGPSPRLVQAMAHHRQGRKSQALQTLAAAVPTFDWRLAAADHRDVWISHILRREAEALILPNLGAFLEGKYQPRDNDERLALVIGCLYSNRPLAAARLCTEAFAADPLLAEDFRSGRRVNAARAAAIAGSGRGEDGAGLGQQERTRWRAQARRWLQGDLAAWSKALDGAASGELVRQTLTHWQHDPDLTGLRDPGELDRMTAEERKDCQALWEEIERVLKRAQDIR